MKLLFVGDFNPNSTNRSQANSFEKFGQCIRFDYREDKDYNKIVQICMTQKIDYVFFSKCNSVDIKIVKKCKNFCKTILWYMDPMNDNWCPNLIKKIQICDYAFFGLHIPFMEALKYSKTCWRT